MSKILHVWPWQPLRKVPAAAEAGMTLLLRHQQLQRARKSQKYNTDNDAYSSIHNRFVTCAKSINYLKTIAADSKL